MALPKFAVNNFRWKLTALFLATLAWFAIKFAIYRGITGRNQTLHHQAVMVLKNPDDPRVLRVQPPYVDVVLQASKELRDEDLEVFVNVTTLPLDIDSAFKEVLVRGRDVVKVIEVQPAWVVRVERVVLPDAALTNVIRKP
jgi:hypothetical protein